jgi:hypothetical protein
MDKSLLETTGGKLWSQEVGLGVKLVSGEFVIVNFDCQLDRIKKGD